MSAGVASGRYDGDRFFPVSGVPVQAPARWAGQLTVTSAGPAPPDSSFIAAGWALWLADGTGKVPQVSQGRPSGRFSPPSS
jgi:hypothetical protein